MALNCFEKISKQCLLVLKESLLPGLLMLDPSSAPHPQQCNRQILIGLVSSVSLFACMIYDLFRDISERLLSFSYFDDPFFPSTCNWTVSGAFVFKQCCHCIHMLLLVYLFPLENNSSSISNWEIQQIIYETILATFRLWLWIVVKKLVNNFCWCLRSPYSQVCSHLTLALDKTISAGA